MTETPLFQIARRRGMVITSDTTEAEARAFLASIVEKQIAQRKAERRMRRAMRLLSAEYYRKLAEVGK